MKAAMAHFGMTLPFRKGPGCLRAEGFLDAPERGRVRDL